MSEPLQPLEALVGQSPRVEKRGDSIEAARVGDLQVLRIILGEKVTYDGTRPAFLEAPAMVGAGSFSVPTPHAGASTNAATAMGYWNNNFDAAVTAGVNIAPPPMTATGTLEAPTQTAGMFIDVPVMLGNGVMMPAEAGEKSGVVIQASWLAATAHMPLPTVGTGVTITPPAMNGTAMFPVPSFGSQFTALPPAMTATGELATPQPNTSARMDSTTASASSSMPTPVVGAGVTITPPAMTGSGAAPVPFVEVKPTETPMGVDLSADYTGPKRSWFTPAGWVPRAGYPDTELTNNLLDLPGPADYVITTDINHGYDYDEFGVRIRAGAQVLATVTAPYHSTHDLVGVSFTHPGGPLTIEVWTWSDFSSAEVIKAGSWVEVDLAP